MIFIVKVKEDLTDMVFGRLTVIKQANDYVSPSGKHMSQWLCQCYCNSEPKVILGRSLKSYNTQSCGCLKKDTAATMRKKYNEWLDEIFEDENGKYRIGLTTNTHKEFYVDEDDFDKVKNYCWYENMQGATSRLQTSDTNTHSIIRMHILLGYKNYDHADRNELNNRKYNLRPCTTQENNRNNSKKSGTTSNFIGVCFDKSRNQWMAYINIEKEKNKNIRSF